MVQFLRGYAIEQGYGMGSTRDPSPAGCVRMLVVTTPAIVAVVTGREVPDGSFIVWNHRTGGLAGPFRMRLSGEAR